MLFTEGKLESIICGSIQVALDAHGTITKKNKTSAAKRIASNIRGLLTVKCLEAEKDKAILAEIAALKKETKLYKEKNAKLCKTLDLYFDKLYENGLILAD
jgi:hypothetical protein